MGSNQKPNLSLGGLAAAKTKASFRREKSELASFHGELPLDARRAAGKALRDKIPREAHAAWSRHSEHPGAVEVVMETNKGRQSHLISLRLARMAASPFAFYRGAAAVMAHDLSRTLATGINVVIDGDAHLNNFGLYGTPQRDIVLDLNDFDEATIGPWEWDLKRLTASLNLAARENGLNRNERDVAVKRCVRGYRFNLDRHAEHGRPGDLVSARLSWPRQSRRQD